MTIIATISGTPSTTVKNATACPGSAACSDLPSRYAATKPSNPAINARSVPTGNPSSCRDTHARAATSTILVASTATTNPNPLTGDDCAASIAPSPGGRTIVMLTPFQARTGGSCALDGAPRQPRGPGLPWRRCDRSLLGLRGGAVSGAPAISHPPPPCRYLLRPGCPGDSAPPGTPGTSPPGRHTRSPPSRAAGPGTGRA